MKSTCIARSLGVAAVCALLAATTAAAATAPGGPGDTALWTPGDKDGFGTATTHGSTVWHTLNGGELTEVYYPNLGTPAVRDLQFVVTDGKSWVDRERQDTKHAIGLVDARSLSYRQVNTDPDGRYRITKTYTTDPSRNVLLLKVRFESLTSEKLALYALYDPGLSGNGDDDSGSTSGTSLVTSDAKAASALVSSPAFTKTSNGYLGSSDGWSDLRSDDSMDWSYDSAPDGNVVQTGRLALTGRRGSQDATIALGFAPSSTTRSARRTRRSTTATPQPTPPTGPGGISTCRSSPGPTASPATRSSTTSR
jgi:glucoamylase